MKKRDIDVDRAPTYRNSLVVVQICLKRKEKIKMSNNNNYNLSESQILELSDIFQSVLIKHNETDTLATEHIHDLFQCLDIKELTTNEFIKYNELLQDDTQNNRITLDKFLYLMSTLLKSSEIDILKSFQLLDEKNTGILDSNELKRLLTIFCKDLSTSQIEQIIKTADPQNNGQIHYHNVIRQLS